MDLRRWDSRVFVDPLEPRSHSSRGLDIPNGKGIVVTARPDDNVAVHIHTVTRSVNDATRRWQRVSDLPAVVGATRRAGVSVVVTLCAVSARRRSRWCDGTGTGTGSASDWSAVGRHCEDVMVFLDVRRATA